MQAAQRKQPLQTGPDATAGALLGVLSGQSPGAASAGPAFTALAALSNPAAGAPQPLQPAATDALAPAARLAARAEAGPAVHTDVVPSSMLNPADRSRINKNPPVAPVVPAPAPFLDPGANGAQDFVPPPPPAGAPSDIPGIFAPDQTNDSSDIAALLHGLPSNPSAGHSSITVTGGVSYFVPANGTIDGAAFAKFWSDSMANPAVVGVRLVQGIYTVVPAKTYNSGIGLDGAYHLVLDCGGRGTPFDFDLNGSKLSLTDGGAGGMAFVKCNGLTVHGATLAYPPSQFAHTQGTVIGVGNAAGMRQLMVQAHDGFPPLWGISTMCSAYANDSLLIRANTSDVVPSAVAQLSATVFALSTSYDLYNIQPGDLLACHGDLGGNGFHWLESRDCLLHDTAFYNPPGHWIAELGCTGTTYVRNVLVPYPGGVGAGQQPSLLSAVGDGVNVLGARSGPTIANNTMRAMSGNGVVVASQMYLVTDANAVTRTIEIACAGPLCYAFDGLDAMSAYTPTLQPLASSVWDIRAGAAAQVPDTMSTTSIPSFNFTAATFRQFTLNSWPTSWAGVSFNYLVMFVPADYAGYTITRNSIGGNRGAGVVIKAPGGTVTNNLISSPKYWGAVPDLDARGAGGYASGLVLVHNTIDAVFGGVQLACLDQYFAPCEFPGHSDVAMTGNLIEHAAALPMLVTSADGIFVSGNVFKSVNCFPWVVYQGYPWLPQFWEAVAFAAYANNVTFSGNQIFNSADCPYGNAFDPYETWQGTVTNLTIS